MQKKEEINHISRYHTLEDEDQLDVSHEAPPLTEAAIDKILTCIARMYMEYKE